MACSILHDFEMTDLTSGGNCSPPVSYGGWEAKEMYIHPYWLTFPKPSSTWHVVIAVACLVIAVCSMVGNATVIYLFINTRFLQNASNVLVVNLAISDFAMTAINCPMLFFSSLYERWIFGQTGCAFYGFAGALTGTTSIIMMAGIALDRYLVICKPTLQFSLSPPQTNRTIILAAFAWVYSACWAIPPLFGISNYVPEGLLTTCGFDYLDESTSSRSFILAMCIGAYVAPLSVIIFAYTSIWGKVRVHRKRTGINTTVESRDHPVVPGRKLRRELNTVKTSAVIVVGWVVAWTPYTLTSFMGIASYMTWLTPVSTQLPALFAKSSAVYNPIIYALFHTRYRQALQKQYLSLPGRLSADAYPRSARAINNYYRAADKCPGRERTRPRDALRNEKLERKARSL